MPLSKTPETVQLVREVYVMRNLHNVPATDIMRELNISQTVYQDALEVIRYGFKKPWGGGRDGGKNLW